MAPQSGERAGWVAKGRRGDMGPQRVQSIVEETKDLREDRRP
jgi:hypothetical protein